MTSYLLSELSSRWSGDGTDVLLRTAAEYGRKLLSDLCVEAVQVKSAPALLEPSALAAWLLLWQLKHEQGPEADGALTAAAAAAAAAAAEAAAELFRPAGDW